jgi:hypothetical protein
VTLTFDLENQWGSRLLRTKFGQNPFKDLDSSVHKDVMQQKFDPVTLTFDLENQ